MFSYRTNLCLLQVGWPGGDALIDTLVDLDLSTLGALFADATVAKVFHGGENDIGILASQKGQSFENIFDTMAAAQILGHEGVGLAASLERHFEVSVSKKFQKADWRVRPLPKEQAEYARTDVQYLISLREILLSDLKAMERVDEAESEFNRINKAFFKTQPFNPDQWVRIKGARDLEPRLRGSLKELYVARDALAETRNWAPYRVLQEWALLEILRRRPKTEKDLKKIRGVSRRLSSTDCETLLDALRKGAKIGEISLPENRRRNAPRGGGIGGMSPEQQVFFDALREWRKKRAEDRGVEVSRVATNLILAAVSRAQPADINALADLPEMEPWRLKEYGKEIMSAMVEAKKK